MAEETTEVIPAEKTALINASSMMPESFANRYTMAKVLAQSGLMPNGMNTPEKVCVALQWGYELGLSPMVAVNNIAVVNGKPSLGTDIMHGIVRHTKEYGGVKWVRQDEQVAECVVYRVSAGYKEEVRGFFDMKMAKAAGLDSKDNWKKYPARMLKHRALSYALRDAFPDILAGIYAPEELGSEEVTATEVRNITPPEELAKANIKQAVKVPETAQSVKQEEIF